MPFFKTDDICIVLTWLIPVGLDSVFVVPLEKSQKHTGCSVTMIPNICLFFIRTQIPVYLHTKN